MRREAMLAFSRSLACMSEQCEKNFMGGTTSCLFDEKPNGTQLQYLGNKQKGKKDGLGNNVDYFQY